MLAIISGYRPLPNDTYILYVEAETKGVFGLQTASVIAKSIDLEGYGATKPTDYIGTAVHINFSSSARKWYLKYSRKETKNAHSNK